MKAIYHRRSQLKNWKMKKHHLTGGGMYFTVHFKSIFGWWRKYKETDEWGDYRNTVRFNTIDKAKELIKNSVSSNVMWLGATVKEVEEIRF